MKERNLLEYKKYKGGIHMPIVDKENLNIDANSKLAMVFSVNNESEIESGHLEYSDYSACVFCIT